MKLSVIVPIYNVEKYLGQCLESIKNQEYTEFEVILVDDGSTDRSGEICDDMADRDERFRVIHKNNEGLIRARKDGIAAAKGEWVGFVDGDDWVDKDFFGLLLEQAETLKVDIVAAGCTREKDGKQEKVRNGIGVQVYRGDELRCRVYPEMLCQEGFFKFGILPYMWNKLFKRHLLEECYEDIDTNVYDGEDVAAVYPYLLSIDSAAVIEETGYHYRIHDGMITAKKRDSYYENVSRLYLHLDKKFKQTENYHIMFPQLCQYMRMMVFQGGPEGFIQSQKYLFPFDRVPKGARIILYGAGNVGKVYCHQMSQLEYCSLAAWVDRDKKGLTIYGIPVTGIERISEVLYDFIVIAVGDRELKEEIAEELKGKNIGVGKIIM